MSIHSMSCNICNKVIGVTSHTCTAQNAVKQMKTHKPRAVLGLTLKGLSIFDEQTKVNKSQPALPLY